MKYTDSTMLNRLTIVTALVFLVGAGCDKAGSKTKPTETTKPAESAEETDDTSVSYSPFGVRLQEGEDYDLISFKDVGLGNPAGVSDATLYETIAQSLAYQMRVDRQFEPKPRVIHNPALADPDNHVYCEKKRVYVDLWRSKKPPKWGYSLWSGCSADARFQWRELEAPKIEAGKLVSGVEPLARDIVESLEEAGEAGCYRRHC